MALTISSAPACGYSNPVFDVLRRQRSVARVMLVLIACSVDVMAEATETRARVVGITDGDTVTVLTEQRRQVRIRLAEIDAPERRQPFGDRARQMLSGLAFERRVRIVVTGTDRNRRVIGRVFVGRLDVNAEMVRRSCAWVFRRYSDDPVLLRLEAEAREAGRGLWSLPPPQRAPPWEWRARRRSR